METKSVARMPWHATSHKHNNQRSRWLRLQVASRQAYQNSQWTTQEMHIVLGPAWLTTVLVLPVCRCQHWHQAAPTPQTLTRASWHADGAAVLSCLADAVDLVTTNTTSSEIARHLDDVDFSVHDVCSALTLARPHKQMVVMNGETAIQGHSRSSAVVEPINAVYITSYWHSIVT